MLESILYSTAEPFEGQPMSTPSADRNLIFGLLALQMDFVTREQLLDSMGAWLLEKQTPLANILCRRGLLAEDERQLLELALQKHLRRHGEDSQASLAALRIEPGVRNDLQRLDDAGVQCSLAAVPGTPSIVDPLGSYAPTAQLFAGTRFRRLRPHAKGGLGELFVALDEELHREVALKEIQDRFADQTDARGRFLREAEITGNLEHPGVVPVYGLGIYPDGRPFYAMRFIRGESMQEAIRRFHAPQAQGLQPLGFNSLAFRQLLGHFVTVCNTVAYAHNRGVIHRDIKPANIMLGEFGETLVVDWGLARVLASADGEETTVERRMPAGSGSATAPTEMGQVVGTPAYMSPEQAEGRLDRLGPASDVFSLGATLYALLTGQAPYHGHDVLDQARRADVVPARQLMRSVPPALEAMCRKAMVKPVQDRYSTARALADDIERWLADEPVKAYREPLPQRMRRWGRRNRTMVAAGVVLLVASVLGLGAGLWAVGREQARTQANLERALAAEEKATENLKQAEMNLSRAQQAEESANRNLRRAEDNLKLARQAIDECFNVAREHPLFQEPRMDEARKLLLEKTFPFYKNFRSQRPDDRRLQVDEAEQWSRVAYIEQTLLRADEAVKTYRKARDMWAKLAQVNPRMHVYQYFLAGMHNNLGLLLTALGKREEALADYRRARDVYASLDRAHAGKPEYQKGLAQSRANLGNLLSSLGRRREALKELLQARSLQSKLVMVYPEESRYWNDLSRTHNNLGNVLRGLSKHEEALKEFYQARDIQVQLARNHVDWPPYQQERGNTHNNLGNLLAALGKREEAMKEYQQARDARTALANAHPDVPEFQSDVGGTHHNLGVLLAGLGKRKEALADYQKAKEIREKLAKQHPNVPYYHQQLALTRNTLGNVLFALGKRTEALKEYEKASSIQARLIRTHADVPAYRQDLALTRFNLGNCLSRLGNRTEALKEYQQSRDLRAGLVKAHPEVPDYQRELANTNTNLGALLLDLGRVEDALGAFRQARDLRISQKETYHQVPEFHRELAIAHNNMAAVLDDLGKRTEALKEYGQARDVGVKLAKAYPRVSAYQKDLADTHHNLALLLAALGQAPEAAEEHRLARDVLTGLTRACPGVGEYVETLVRVCMDRGALLGRMNRLSEALSELDEGIARAEDLRRLVPEHAQVAALLLFGLAKRAGVLTRLGKQHQADTAWEHVLKLALPAQRDPVRLQRADSRARAGDYLRAAAEADELGVGNLPGPVLYNLAVIHVLDAESARRNMARPLPEREKRAELYARAAVVMLKRATGEGHFREPAKLARLDHDADLAFLRDRDDYKRLRAGLPPVKMSH
jgi:serine/threonine-protein kinase